MNPSNTVARLPAFLTGTFLGVLIGRAMSLEEFTRFLGLLGCAVAFICLAAVALLPSARGLPPWDDVWRGIFGHKNDLGSACAVLLPFTLFGFLNSPKPRRYLFALGSLGLLVLLVESESRTAQLIGALGLANLALSMLLRRFRFGWVAVTGCALMLCVIALPLILASGAAQPVFDLVGREPTLSGRIPLWRVIWPWVEQRPMLGYGYAAFWEADTERVVHIMASPSVQWEMNYSHNGALETLLDVGAVGVTLLAAVYIRAFWALLVLLRRHPTIGDLAPMFIFLIAFLLANLTEATALQRENLMWMVFVAVVVRLRTVLRAERCPERPHSAVTALR